MASLTADVGKRLERLPQELHDEFPQNPIDTIRQDVASDARAILARAHFTDFVPVLVHRTVRQRILAHEPRARLAGSGER